MDVVCLCVCVCTCKQKRKQVGRAENEKGTQCRVRRTSAGPRQKRDTVWLWSQSGFSFSLLFKRLKLKTHYFLNRFYIFKMVLCLQQN